jgi:hypothetical protein
MESIDSFAFKANSMLVAEKKSLNPVRVLINNAKVCIELFGNTEGSLFLSSVTRKPGGVIYYAVTPPLFCAFLQNTLTLQALFDESPSHFMEITTPNKTALYSRTDVEIELVHGDKTILQLNSGIPIEIWECGSGH